MAGSPALLLLLSLGLCCTTAQQQRNTMEARFLDRNMKHPQQGQRLELECRTSRTTLAAYWFRQDKDGNLHYIATSNSRYNRKFYVYNRISQRFEVSWRDSSPRLVVKSFMAQDQGIYFCINLINQELHFSSGQPAFFPVTTTTAAPTTPAATTQSSLITKKDICLQSSDPGTSNENLLNFYCEIFIWAPLAGVCLVLLVALIVTIVLCQKTRRRRCRCKRPPNGKPGAKPPVPTRHI
ncbi:T-cell surface glycoprotein CD8 alpha chain isoform X2 [Coturnix japonica]|uniref:T-cell surface glycoprotein CD8 alpha chain isoform X2 n=1 Tax=Coturnix japonica TaxID=93934 RepID=UPI000776BA7B|nr:T-cell surface glycoprotein CD8 alpha chain isoform X2 [Coturnix japonica]